MSLQVVPMNFKIKAVLFLTLLSNFVYGQEELPDNYLPINFTIKNNELVGISEYLEGFVFSMSLNSDSLTIVPEKDELFSKIKKNEIRGTLTYPNDRVTEIKYELVNHRGITGIYMKTTLGYFMWEKLNIDINEIFVAINWWYCPPATETDIEILNSTYSLLSNPSKWHQNDDRKCENDIESDSWSLFCALKYSSIEAANEYNHHNTAVQTVRFVIDDLQPNHGYEHTLMDFNNNSITTHSDILRVIKDAKKRISKELDEYKNKD